MKNLLLLCFTAISSLAGFSNGIDLSSSTVFGNTRLTKLTTTRVEYEASLTELYSYDDDGRLISAGPENNPSGYKFDYSRLVDNIVIMTVGGWNRFNITLNEQGYAASVSSGDGKYCCTYTSDGYLKTLIYEDITDEGDPDRVTYEFHYSNNCMTDYVYTKTTDDPEDTATKKTEISYTNMQNSAGFTLPDNFYDIEVTGINMVFLAGYLGKASYYLPETVRTVKTNQYDDISRKDRTFKWTVSRNEIESCEMNFKRFYGANESDLDVEYNDILTFGWKTLAGIESVGADADGIHSEIEQIYTPEGLILSELQSGINIVRYSDGSTRKILIRE